MTHQLFHSISRQDQLDVQKLTKLMDWVGQYGEKLDSLTTKLKLKDTTLFLAVPPPKRRYRASNKLGEFYRLWRSSHRNALSELKEIAGYPKPISRDILYRKTLLIQPKSGKFVIALQIVDGQLISMTLPTINKHLRQPLRYWPIGYAVNRTQNEIYDKVKNKIEGLSHK